MVRVAAVITIFVGAAVAGFDPARWDAVIFNLPRRHGVHVTDVLGLVLVTAGVVALWRTPPSNT